MHGFHENTRWVHTSLFIDLVTKFAKRLQQTNLMHLALSSVAVLLHNVLWLGSGRNRACLTCHGEFQFQVPS